MKFIVSNVLVETIQIRFLQGLSDRWTEALSMVIYVIIISGEKVTPCVILNGFGP